MTIVKTRSPRPLARLLPLLAFLVLGLGGGRPAVAYAPNQRFHGGTMRNLTVDVVFWGYDFSQNDRSDVRDYIKDLANLVNGGFDREISDSVNGGLDSPGWEAAVHYYGLWGLTPGVWIDDYNPIPSSKLWGTSGYVLDADVQNEIATAQRGSFGQLHDFDGNPVPGPMPAAPYRLALVVTKGGNKFSVQGQTGSGYHFNSGNNPYGGVMFDGNGPGTRMFPPILSHEIAEAMTDTIPSGGWRTDEPTSEEVCDYCKDAINVSLRWWGSSGLEITGIDSLTLNPSFGPTAFLPLGSCIPYEPEEYAPMSATLEYAAGPAGAPLVLVYRRPDGGIGEVWWYANQSAGGGSDLGHPPGVTARGKPSIVYDLYNGGEYVFIRGSDNALWMHFNNQWTWLGGQLYGDPSAVVFAAGYLDVFVLGTDNRIYAEQIFNQANVGWTTIPNNTTRAFSGPPKAFARDTWTIDLFAIGEEGHLYWLPFSSSTGWDPAHDLGNMTDGINHSPVSVTSWAPSRMDLFGTSEGMIGSRFWNGSTWGGYSERHELGNTPSGSPAVVTWGTNRLDAFVVDRQFRLQHTYSTDAGSHWNGDVNNPMASDAQGDPVLISRGSNSLDVFYRTTSGSLTHLYWNGGWTYEANVLPAYSIQ
jgi:hypothetical protein